MGIPVVTMGFNTKSTKSWSSMTQIGGSSHDETSIENHLWPEMRNRQPNLSEDLLLVESSALSCAAFAIGDPETFSS